MNALYDPHALRASPLGELFGAEEKGDAVAGLRRILLGAIESLRPARETPQGARAWRVYQILRRRYTEGLSQRQAAADLGLSIRQLQREEKLAREMLADQLWSTYELEGRVPDAADAESDDDPDLPEEAPAQSLQEELEWLRTSTPVQLTDVVALIRDVLETIEPLMETPAVTTGFRPEGAGRVALRGPIVRQALLDVISTAVRYAQGGRVHVDTEFPAQQTSIRIVAFRPEASGNSDGPNPEVAHSESLDIAVQLIHLCDGTIEVGSGPMGTEGVFTGLCESANGAPAFVATIRLPTPAQALVLAIDDNDDALQLLQRYLAGSAYLLVGTRDAAHGLELAAELQPQVILLDVMMPERDGWTLLGQLREHPATGQIPVIVCTILSQRELALVLGAAGFIRKPVTRAELLATLERLAAPVPESP